MPHRERGPSPHFTGASSLQQLTVVPGKWKGMALTTLDGTDLALVAVVRATLDE